VLQGHRLPSVQLVLPVHMSTAEAEPQLVLSVKAIAVACAWLQERGVQSVFQSWGTAGAQPRSNQDAGTIPEQH